MKIKWCGALVFCMLGSFCPVASAATITWTLQGATFVDGGAATGFFNFDTVSNTITTWSISVSGGNTVNFPPLTYDPGNSYAVADMGELNVPLSRFSFYIGQSRYLSILVENSLPPGGGTDPFHIWPDNEPGHSGGYECLNCAPWRNFSAGQLVGQEAAIPEPASVALVGVGLALAALRRRRS